MKEISEVNAPAMALVGMSGMPSKLPSGSFWIREEHSLFFSDFFVFLSFSSGHGASSALEVFVLSMFPSPVKSQSAEICSHFEYINSISKVLRESQVLIVWGLTPNIFANC